MRTSFPTRRSSDLDADEFVRERAALERRDDAERHADEELEQERGEGELERVTEPLEEEARRRTVIEDRLAREGRRPADVEEDRRPKPVAVLDRRRLVEAVGVAQRLDVLPGEGRRTEGAQAHRVAGSE